MIKKKNGFFTFCCSLIPGAGEMYLGFMKEGVSMMALFLGSFVLMAFLGLDVFTLLLPIIWFYSFFNVHNKASLPDEEFYALEDDYLFHMEQIIPEGHLNGRQTTVFAWILILLGISILWGPIVREFLRFIGLFLSDELLQTVRSFLRQLPRYVVAILLIASGIHLIRNKKKELEQEDTKEVEK